LRPFGASATAQAVAQEGNSASAHRERAEARRRRLDPATDHVELPAATAELVQLPQDRLIVIGARTPGRRAGRRGVAREPRGWGSSGGDEERPHGCGTMSCPLLSKPINA